MSVTADSLQAQIQQMFSRELQAHGRAFVMYKALPENESKHFDLPDLTVQTYYNVGRKRSVMAQVDEKSLAARACFLCPDGLEPNQLTTFWQSPYQADERGRYCLRVNPFPIFEEHFTISAFLHERQQILPHLADLWVLTEQLPAYTLFYNGPHCGASAPDHMHFQAVPQNALPLQKMCAEGKNLERLYQTEQTQVFHLTQYAPAAWYIRSSSKAELTQEWELIYQHTPCRNGEWEPRLNVVAWWGENQYHCLLFLRQESRPACFFKTGNEQLLISPASVEMSGVAVVCDENSFHKLTLETLLAVVQEVSLDPTFIETMNTLLRTQQQPLTIGILSAPQIRFALNGQFQNRENGQIYEGEQVAQLQDGQILFDGQKYAELSFLGTQKTDFTLHEVVIGVHFHWERKEDQRFGGNLKIIVEHDQLTAIDCIGVEDYLQSVISSEMSATSHLELLKAHAVISRSWVLRPLLNPQSAALSNAMEETDERHICWYERDAHEHFDVCADDHCQRYQGLTRQTSEKVKEAVQATWGEVLTYNGKVCDARFYKSCGGATELFSNCWADEEHPYLQAVRDEKEASLPDLTDEQEAQKWIRTAPPAFCNTHDKAILSQVLNNYDQETTDFYRWTVVYTAQELHDLILQKSGIDFGEIIDLRPLRRGPSARIYELEIVGSQRTLTIGKELEIRKWLSPSHLYSSAFVVDKATNEQGETTFTLLGAGWGHGVGLCQIGAAVMATEGYSYRQILAHYFPGSCLTQLHETGKR